jgi:hypothetical protein
MSSRASPSTRAPEHPSTRALSRKQRFSGTRAQEIRMKRALYALVTPRLHRQPHALQPGRRAPAGGEPAGRRRGASWPRSRTGATRAGGARPASQAGGRLDHRRRLGRLRGAGRGRSHRRLGRLRGGASPAAARALPPGPLDDRLGDAGHRGPALPLGPLASTWRTRFALERAGLSCEQPVEGLECERGRATGIVSARRCAACARWSRRRASSSGCGGARWRWPSSASWASPGSTTSPRASSSRSSST